MSVLVAEDDAAARRVLQVMLGRWGYPVRTVTDGLEAWEVLQAPDAPSLAILDWMMPRLEGVEVCRRVRAAGLSAHIILLTAKVRREDMLAGFAAGADDYLRKPFDASELQARLRVGERLVQLQHAMAQRLQELHASEARFRAIVDASYDALLVVDADDAIHEFSPAAERMFGRSVAEVVGQCFTALLAPGPSCETYACARRKVPSAAPCELYAVRRSGEQFPVELTVTAIGTSPAATFAVLLRDIGERRRLEVQLRHAQKLEAVGSLAAGIAHEINTPIQFIGDNVHFLGGAFGSLSGLLTSYREAVHRLVPDSSGGSVVTDLVAAEESAEFAYLQTEVPRAVAGALDGVKRVATIVRAMKAFAHPDGGEKRPADLNEAVRSTLTVARNELKYVAEVETELGDLPPVVCHLGDINQVLLNLLINAAHAVEDVVRDTGAKGRIHVRTAVDGDCVTIVVRDTGSGIPSAIRDRIFDPFFTTKEVGRGTGQGLAIARSIVVQKHGGSLSLATEVGRGSTFTVRLPIRPPDTARDVAA